MKLDDVFDREDFLEFASDLIPELVRDVRDIEMENSDEDLGEYEKKEQHLVCVAECCDINRISPSPKETMIGGSRIGH